MQTNYATVQDAGAEVVSVVVASMSDVEGWCQRAGVSYPMLADVDHEVSQAYGVYDLRHDGRAAPTVFVIDTEGRIVWSRVAANTSDFVDTATILEHLP